MVIFVPAKAQYDLNQFFYRGQEALMEGRYADAITSFNVITQLDDSLYEAFFFRGIAKYNLGDFLGAKKDFDTALDKNPLYTPAYHYRAITLSRLGKNEEALADLQEAISLRPSYSGLYFSRGVTYFLSQRFEEAVKDFDRFLVFEPKVADAYLNRGACYLYLGDTLKALDDYNKAIKLNKFDPESYIRRSRVRSMMKENDMAVDDLNQAIALDSANTFAYFNRAIIKYETRDFKGALADLDKVLQFEPDNALTLYNRALLRTQTGDFNRALQDYDAVLNINPENVLVYYNRAAVFYQLGRYQDALEDYTQAINLYPDFAKAYMNRSFVKEKLGQYASAAEDYQIAQQKISKYQHLASEDRDSEFFADTTVQYDRLLALDADFARKEFNDELLQHKNVDITLMPLYKFTLSETENSNMAFEHRYEDERYLDFLESVPVNIELTNVRKALSESSKALLSNAFSNYLGGEKKDVAMFLKALLEAENNKYNDAILSYGQAIDYNPGQVFYYFNRGVLQSEMIDFISSVGTNVRVLTMDDQGITRARVQNEPSKTYDYSAAINDMKIVAGLYPEFPYTYYNMGNMYCRSGELPEAISQYDKALELYPYIGEAYYNRGLVLIYLKDKEKGCLDLSKAGELGIKEAYNVINRYCSE